MTIVASKRTEVNLLISVNDFQAAKIFCNQESQRLKNVESFLQSTIIKTEKNQNLLQHYVTTKENQQQSTTTKMKVR